FTTDLRDFEWRRRGSNRLALVDLASAAFLFGTLCHYLVDGDTTRQCGVATVPSPSCPACPAVASGCVCRRGDRRGLGNSGGTSRGCAYCMVAGTEAGTCFFRR